MRAVVFKGPGAVAVVERPDPRPGPGEVVVHPTYVGASAVDVHAFTFAGGASARRPAPDQVMGSEVAGTVTEVGPGVERLRPGDRVSVDPRRYCGVCMQCRAGQYSTCEREGGGLGTDGIDGALAELVLVRARNCYPLPAGVTDLQAALVPAAVRAVHGMRTAAVGVADNVGVFGLDDVGLATLQLARSVTVGTVVAADSLPRRRELATTLGADLFVDPADDAASAQVLAAAPKGLDVVFVSSPEQLASEAGLLTLAITALRLKGTVGITQVLGTRAWDAVNDVPYIPLRREATIHNMGSIGNESPLLGGRERGDWVATLQAFERGRIDTDSLDIRVVPFTTATDAEIGDALRSVPDTASKVVFAMNGTGA